MLRTAPLNWPTKGHHFCFHTQGGGAAGGTLGALEFRTREAAVRGVGATATAAALAAHHPQSQRLDAGALLCSTPFSTLWLVAVNLKTTTVEDVGG